MKIGNDIYYVGVNDHQIDLFEGQYVVPNGMSYNSYVIMDEKIAVMDTVDANFKDEWLENVARVLDGAKPDYLVVQHMEPDHAANIENFMKADPDTTVVANTKTFTMMENFFRGMDLEGKKHIVANGDSLTLGKHVLTFVFAPMVHWPEVMVTYDSKDKVLFSADGFGKFGAHVLLIAGTFSAAALELIAQLTLERADFMLKLLYLPILRGGAAELRYNDHKQHGADGRKSRRDI